MKKSYYVIFMTSKGVLTALPDLIVLTLILNQGQRGKAREIAWFT